MSIDAYHALKPSSSDTRQVLDAIANAPSFSFTESQRKELVQSLLDDIKDPDARIGKQNVVHALNAIKMVGRQPVTALIIAKQENLDLLAVTITADDAQVVYNAMKIVANTLLLVLDTALERWLATSGPAAAHQVLRTRHEPEPMFLAARILFLCTTKPLPFVRQLVEKDGGLDTLISCYDPALVAFLDNKQWAKDALIDLLKVTFNLLLNYPRLLDAEADPAAPPKPMGESWSAKLEPLLAPLLRTFAALPQGAQAPFVPPLTHVVHSLINIPVAPYAEVWLSPSPSPSRASSASAAADGTAPHTHLHRMLKLLPGVHRRSASPKPPSSSSSAPSSRPESPAPLPPIDVTKKAYDLFEAATAWYMPDDPDDAAVRAKASKEDINLDDTLSPLVILLTRLADGSDVAKARLREWLIPANLDRSSPLEERKDLLGRCLRALKSVYFARIKDTVGELLFTICDSDATTLAAQVGYGNVAGYLFNKGLVAPPPASSTSSAGENLPEGDINPITGMRVDPNAQSGLDDMTDEEKEREAERLFVLFDRLEKTGMGVQNPFRKAFQEGKIQYP